MRKLRKIGMGLVAGGLLTCAGAAQAEFSANVALTSDYVWRFVSQTNEEPAIQGGFDWTHKPTGIFLGTWGSNVDFGGDEQLELDLYGGWGTEFGNGVGLEIGGIYYKYFKDPGDISFFEGYGKLSYKWLYGQVNYDFDNKNIYYEAGLNFELPQKFNLALKAGYYKFDQELAPGVDSYSGWGIGVSKEFGGFGFDISVYDTNSDAQTAFGKDITDTRVVLTVSKSM